MPNNIKLPLKEVESILKRFVIEECYGSDFDMFDDEQTMKVFKAWWKKQRLQIIQKHKK
jgi:hypothetical protein